SFFLTFFFNDTAPPEIYTLSLHDALPILQRLLARLQPGVEVCARVPVPRPSLVIRLTQARPTERKLRVDAHRPLEQRDRLLVVRSEEHTSELQSPCNLVCRLLLEKKKNK